LDPDLAAALLDAAPVVIFVKDRQGRLL